MNANALPPRMVDDKTRNVMANAIPDRSGVNFFDDDAELQSLLKIYLPAPLHAHLLPHFKRLGALAGGLLDRLANTADHNPPTLEHRTRTGLDAQSVVKHPAFVAWPPCRTALVCSTGSSRCRPQRNTH
jgi:Adaptive response protein AidB N-terminal domain